MSLDIYKDGTGSKLVLAGTDQKLDIAGLKINGGPGSLSHDFKICPITFQGSGHILFSCEKISL